MVHRDFKIIIHLPQSKLKDTALPFLNRFEKFIVNTSDILTEAIPKLGEPIPILLKAISSGMEDFVSYLHPSSFYGYLKEETIASFLVSIIKATDDQNFRVPTIPPSLVFGSFENGSEEVR